MIPETGVEASQTRPAVPPASGQMRAAKLLSASCQWGSGARPMASENETAETRIARARSGTLQRIHRHAFDFDLDASDFRRGAGETLEAGALAVVDDVIDARQISLGQLKQACGQMLRVGRRAVSVADGFETFAAPRAFDHRRQKISPADAENPARSHDDGARRGCLRASLAFDFRDAVDASRRGVVALRVEALLVAVENVIGRDGDERRARRATGSPPESRPPGRSRWMARSGSSSQPSTSVHAAQLMTVSGRSRCKATLTACSSAMSSVAWPCAKTSSPRAAQCSVTARPTMPPAPVTRTFNVRRPLRRTAARKTRDTRRRARARSTRCCRDTTRWFYASPSPTSRGVASRVRFRP